MMAAAPLQLQQGEGVVMSTDIRTTMSVCCHVVRGKRDKAQVNYTGELRAINMIRASRIFAPVSS